MQLGFNMIILAISEIIAILTADRFIDFSNPQTTLSYNLLVCGVILLSFNLTFKDEAC